MLSSITSLHIVYALADTLVLYFADRHSLTFSMVCMLLWIPSLHLLRIRIYTEPPPAEAHHA